MATWATVRNSVLNGVSTAVRARQFLSFMDNHLVVTAGWTRIGSGGGTGSGLYAWGAAKVLPAFPSAVGMATLAWGVYQNATGAQVLFRVSTDYVYMQYSGSLGYAVGLADEDTLPTAPADNIVFTTSTAHTAVGSVADSVIQLAYTTDHNSFIVFGKRAATDDFNIALVKLEDFKIGDLQPYWGFCRVGSASDSWTVARVGVTIDADTSLGYHPVNGSKIYTVGELEFNGISAFLNTPVDPVSLNHQKLELLYGCTVAGSVHLRGKIPGVYRVSSALNTGDRLSLSGGVYEQIVIGDYAVPWMSADAMTW